VRRFTLAVIALLLFTTTAAAAATWIRPVDGPVVEPFEHAPTPYAAGHRGVDFAATGNTPVRASRAGIVTFADRIAGATHVVVQHDNGWRTSYAFLATTRVERGALVAQGDVVGTTGGAGHASDVLHFGLRIGDAYADPLRLFSPGPPADRVHLAPIEGD
jgi:murein DD-endopeptidase MepM/ murein hydrolase activator NlpD